jgi:hypothetical protein
VSHQLIVILVMLRIDQDSE